MKLIRFYRILLFVLVVLFLFSSLSVYGENGEKTIYIISVDGEITPAMASFVKGAVEEANRGKAQGIIIDISTLGGRVDSAISMKDAIFASSADVVVYISSRAISAGALISISSEVIAMAPGSHIGSAEPVPNEPKALAFVKGEFESAAERTGRDPEIAMAMVDASISIEGLVQEGEILDLTANQALLYGYADFMAENIDEVLEKMGWSDGTTIFKSPNYRFKIAHFLTSYEVASLLITLGIFAIIAELFTPGFGVAGITGITCFVLYFAGGFLAGTTDLWAVFIFLAGIVLLIIELMIPGFGLFGISGIAALLIGIILSAPTIRQGVITLSISTAAIIIGLPIIIKLTAGSKFMRRLVLTTTEAPSQGYVHAPSKESFLGKTGVAHTVLRPSGSIMVDGEKIDAITDGEYAEKGAKVVVIKVEGGKVIVRSMS